MENTKLLFYGTTESETNKHTLEVYVNTNNQLFINIENESQNYGFIVLNRSTAIKLSKELKKQISKLS